MSELIHSNILEETVQPYHVRDVSHVFSMIPKGIPDPAFIKRKVFLAKDAGNDHGMVLANPKIILA